MKKFPKLCILIGTAMVILGVCFTILSFAAVNFDPTKLKTSFADNASEEEDELVQQILTSDADSIKELIIDTVNSEITITATEESTAKITYYSNNRVTYTEYNSDGVFGIKQHIKNDTKSQRFPSISMWSDFFDLINGEFNQESTKYKINIELPSSVLSDISLISTNGFIDMKSISCTGLSIQTTNGEILLNEVETSDKMHIHSTNASIELYKTTVGDAAVLEIINGNIVLDNTAGNKLDISLTNGDIDLFHTKMNELHLNCVNGSIEGDFAQKKDLFSLELATSFGNIEINDEEYSKNYSFTGKQQYYIEASNTHGDISLYFSE
jgi:hypothetical protein